MQNTELQQVLVFVNSTHGFVHVGIYNMTDKHGKPNYSAKLAYLYKNASRIQNTPEYINSIGADMGFGSSFFVRLMNTELDEWVTAQHFQNISVFDAQELAIELRSFYENDGYDVTGITGAKPIRRDGTSTKYANNVVIKNATMSRLHQIVDKLTEGMTDIDIKKVRADIYSKYNFTAGFDTRRKFWHHIMRNWDKYAA